MDDDLGEVFENPDPQVLNGESYMRACRDLHQFVYLSLWDSLHAQGLQVSLDTKEQRDALDKWRNSVVEKIRRLADREVSKWRKNAGVD